MKLMIHCKFAFCYCTLTHCKQGKGKFKQILEISICIGDILINKSDSQRGSLYNKYQDKTW